MTARVVTGANGIFVEATLAEWQAAGHFEDFPPTDMPVRLGMTSPRAAAATAHYVNTRVKARADLAAARAYAEQMERGGHGTQDH